MSSLTEIKPCKLYTSIETRQSTSRAAPSPLPVGLRRRAFRLRRADPPDRRAASDGSLVCIKTNNSKYVILSAYLSGLASGIRRGAIVASATIIGYAGNTGGPTSPSETRTCTRLTVTLVQPRRVAVRRRWAAGGLSPLPQHRGRHRTRRLQMWLDVQLDDLGKG